MLNFGMRCSSRSEMISQNPSLFVCLFVFLTFNGATPIFRVGYIHCIVSKVTSTLFKRERQTFWLGVWRQKEWLNELWSQNLQIVPHEWVRRVTHFCQSFGLLAQIWCNWCIIGLLVWASNYLPTRISWFSGYTLAIFTEYTGWGAFGGHKLEVT